MTGRSEVATCHLFFSAAAAAVFSAHTVYQYHRDYYRHSPQPRRALRCMLLTGASVKLRMVEDAITSGLAMMHSKAGRKREAVVRPHSNVLLRRLFVRALVRRRIVSRAERLYALGNLSSHFFRWIVSICLFMYAC